METYVPQPRRQWLELQMHDCSVAKFFKPVSIPMVGMSTTSLNRAGHCTGDKLCYLAHSAFKAQNAHQVLAYPVPHQQLPSSFLAALCVGRRAVVWVAVSAV